MSTEVIVLDFFASAFAMRAKIALLEKGVEFEARHEDLFGTKSDLLLQSNPIYKKVPVLVHDSKAVSESLIILEYIDETWPTPKLLPACAYGRSRARFWADFCDKKLFPVGSKIWQSKGEAQEGAVTEFLEGIKLLEVALGDKDFFGGETLGFLDIVVVTLGSWFYSYELCGGFKVEDSCPKFSAWMKRCAVEENIAKVLPASEKIYECVLSLKKMNGIE